MTLRQVIEGTACGGWIEFAEWSGGPGDRRSGWIVVGLWLRDWGRETGCVVSGLCRANSRKERSLLRRRSWGFVVEEFGHPSWGYLGDKPVYLQYGIAEKGLVPFAIYRKRHDREEPYFDLLQEFVLYHDAHLEYEGGQWIAVDENGSKVVVARLVTDSQRQEVRLEVSEHALRDFLTSGPWVLVRFHDRGRFAQSSSAPAEYMWRVRRYSGDLWSYRVTVKAQTNGRVASDLIGQDVVRPYAQVPKHRRWWEEDRQYEEFLVGVDDNGEAIYRTCDHRRLRGSERFTSVFFRPEVLERYRGDPKFSVCSRGLSCGSKWGLNFWVNVERLIHVWLGDLGRLPYEHQKHWRGHNVPPAGGAPAGRFETEFLLEPAPHTEPDIVFWETYEKIAEQTERVFGFRLFRELPQDDKHHKLVVGWPIPDAADAFDRQIVALAKVLCESIDVAGLRKLVKPEVLKRLQGSIDKLEATLQELGCPESVVRALVGSLRLVQGLRSTGGAHRRGAKWEQLMRKHRFANLPLDQVHEQVLKEVNRGLEAFLSWVEGQSPLRTP